VYCESHQEKYAIFSATLAGTPWHMCAANTRSRRFTGWSKR
jgi:hypothetical protein